jgi:hypothetical protein
MRPKVFSLACLCLVLLAWALIRLGWNPPNLTQLLQKKEENTYEV